MCKQQIRVGKRRQICVEFAGLIRHQFGVGPQNGTRCLWGCQSVARWWFLTPPHTIRTRKKKKKQKYISWKEQQQQQQKIVHWQIPYFLCNLNRIQNVLNYFILMFFGKLFRYFLYLFFFIAYLLFLLYSLRLCRFALSISALQFNLTFASSCSQIVRKGDVICSCSSDLESLCQHWKGERV